MLFLPMLNPAVASARKGSRTFSLEKSMAQLPQDARRARGRVGSGSRTLIDGVIGEDQFSEYMKAQLIVSVLFVDRVLELFCALLLS